MLSWAYNKPGWTAIVDDRAARRCAEVLQINVLGSVGVVLLAKTEGRIALARPVLESLIRAGLHSSDILLERALQLAGEG